MPCCSPSFHTYGYLMFYNRHFRSLWLPPICLPYMTLQLLPSEFPYIWGKFSFLFYQCTYFIFAAYPLLPFPLLFFYFLSQNPFLFTFYHHLFRFGTAQCTTVNLSVYTSSSLPSSLCVSLYLSISLPPFYNSAFPRVDTIIMVWTG